MLRISGGSWRKKANLRVAGLSPRTISKGGQLVLGLVGIKELNTGAGG